MQPSDFTRFHAVMTGIAELHQRELSDFLLDAYWLSLRDWSLQDFESAASHLVQTLKWMPKPSDFTDLRKAGEPTAGEAWVTALSGAPLVPGSCIARAAQVVGGQYAMRYADIERDLPHIQRRFIDAYNELSDVDPVREAVPQIAEHGARKALRGPAPIADVVPKALAQRPAQQPTAGALSAPKVAPAAAKVAQEPPKSARDKILALLPLGMDDEAVAKVSGQPLDVVRLVRADQECAV